MSSSFPCQLSLTYRSTICTASIRIDFKHIQINSCPCPPKKRWPQRWEFPLTLVAVVRDDISFSSLETLTLFWSEETRPVSVERAAGSAWGSCRVCRDAHVTHSLSTVNRTTWCFCLDASTRYFSLLFSIDFPGSSSYSTVGAPFSGGEWW